MKRFMTLLLAVLFCGAAGTASAQELWFFSESGMTSGCSDTRLNGPYIASASWVVTSVGGTLAGCGVDVNENSTQITGTGSSTQVQFTRRGPGWTPGYTVDWDYHGTPAGSTITGNFSGGGDPGDPNGLGCATTGTFTIAAYETIATYDSGTKALEVPFVMVDATEAWAYTFKHLGVRSPYFKLIKATPLP